VTWFYVNLLSKRACGKHFENKNLHNFKFINNTVSNNQVGFKKCNACFEIFNPDYRLKKMYDFVLNMISRKNFY